MANKKVVNTTNRRGLTPKQKRFVDEYLIDLNATQAAIRAGYSEKTAYSIGEENLRKPEIKKAIEIAQSNRSERTNISQDEVLRDLQELRDICMGRKKIIVSEVDKQTGTAMDVEISVFEPVSANRALDLLGKHLGMFNQKIELSGTVTNQNISLTKNEFRDIAKEVLSEV